MSKETRSLDQLALGTPVGEGADWFFTPLARDRLVGAEVEIVVNPATNCRKTSEAEYQQHKDQKSD